MFQISSSTLNGWLSSVAEGSWTGGRFGQAVLSRCLQKLLDYIEEDVFPGVLPSALTVAGAILVVTLAWRMFRNFTKG